MTTPNTEPKAIPLNNPLKTEKSSNQAKFLNKEGYVFNLFPKKNKKFISANNNKKNGIKYITDEK